MTMYGNIRRARGSKEEMKRRRRKGYLGTTRTSPSGKQIKGRALRRRKKVPVAASGRLR